MKNRWLVVTAIIGIALIGLVAVGHIMSDVETLNYDIAATENNIEVRRYKPMIVAEVQINGRREDTISNGFRLLADYIFGNNIARRDIAMTAPVQQQSIGDDWQISFVMPANIQWKHYPNQSMNMSQSKKSLPKPLR